ncbi:TetR/AcrR family transcriptional regulator [Thaumasiovibrio subtropicus]|uniref:TetR/AcrR family transcriptional regulator n=1 Tax=Thaumasiovibrio subtropicus TaxID=1891207 RepID=UPI00192CECF0|nr:TetR/AcrR family transcriptional regulator [Thaumasiovibrio subtropicus]
MVGRRAKKIEETRAKLIKTARFQFGSVGYSETVMDDLTSQAGLTRGALYHHFGDKKGLFKAVLEEIDKEIDAELLAIEADAADLWTAFVERCHLYLEKTTAPEVQRIMLRDAASVLDADLLHSMRLECVESIASLLERLQREQVIFAVNPVLQARFINGGLMELAVWIAKSDDRDAALMAARKEVDLTLTGLRCDRGRREVSSIKIGVIQRRTP